MSQTDKCVHTLEIALKDLRAEGMDTVFIMGALGEICVRAAKSEPEQAADYLDSLIAVLDANAQAIRAGTVINMAQALF